MGPYCISISILNVWVDLLALKIYNICFSHFVLMRPCPADNTKTKEFTN